MSVYCMSKVATSSQFLNTSHDYSSLFPQAKLIPTLCDTSEISLPLRFNSSNEKNGTNGGLTLSCPKRRNFVGRTFCKGGACTFKEAAVESRSDTAEEKIGVLLLNLGGPDTLRDVQPFLFNLFADPDIIRLPRLFRFLQRPLAQLISTLRAPKSKEAYASIGGGSPLRKITDEQANALKLALEAKEVPVNVYVAMRYWHPFTEEAVHQIKRDRIDRLVVLPLYPQYSISTTGSSVRVLRDMFRDDTFLSRLPVAIIQSWYQRKGYIKSMADLIVKELQKFPDPKETMIFFSAHGVPVSYVEDAGDPYRDQMEDCIYLIVQELKSRGIKNSHTLAYQAIVKRPGSSFLVGYFIDSILHIVRLARKQSRVGPVQWLKPYTDEVLVELGQQGVKSLLAVPISFVSEHIETLEEIDMEYKELALESGVVNWGRVPALNCTESFITDLADAIIDALPSAMAISSSSASGKAEENDGVTYGIKMLFDEIINEIRSLVSGISSEKRWKTESKEAQGTILQEIKKNAAEAYSNFRGFMPSFTDTDVLEDEALEPPVIFSSGAGSGFEILCQGFNWESHKSGKWYTELHEKASELAKLGFTVIWLPPPTDSVSPEGYMPKDLYNLNSRYGNMDQLKALVKKLHQVGIKALGDAVINHRCAHKQNQNGVWNIFGGRLDWDDRAVVADDPYFQGRGNQSSGENFHAAPNIDHSQEFVRKDIKEWLLWLREEIGYDGWRLDFVRGFWGGYVKEYLEYSQPYFAVGEFWDSLSYMYGEMDHNQDAHRQRIVDWINATDGTAGAFDVTTKGILHAALERCEYWRLSDEKGKPPGVVGWWPSRAVTFIENHDTGSTQGHWRFPGGKEMQGYAYILTHPGTPSVFYDHIFSVYQNEIAALLSIRKRKKINCRSSVNIVKAERDVYAAIIDEKLAMKIGPGHFEPSDLNGRQKWSFVTEGRDYKIWEA